MIVYKLTDGFASDLRYEQADYVLKVDEVKFADGFGMLSLLDSLHDPVAVQAKASAKEAERLRLANLSGDAIAQQLLVVLRDATPKQIDTYITNNVTDLASARLLLKRILFVLALLARTVSA